MYMNHFQEQRAEWTILLKKKSNQELINTFNSSVGINAFGVYRSIYLSVLQQEIVSRSWDCSQIVKICPNTNSVMSISFALPVELINNKLVQIKNYFLFNREKIFLN